MKTMKVSELSGVALDWAVALADKHPVTVGHNHTMTGPMVYDKALLEMDVDSGAEWQPTLDQTGDHIIDREGITTIRCDDDYAKDANGYTTNQRIPVWAATLGQHNSTTSYEHQQMDPTYMISQDDLVYGTTRREAAMRCYVASKLGETVSIPEELL